MSAARTAGQVALLTVGVAATGVLGYAIYFDYMRRHSSQFRKGIKSQHRQLERVAEERTKAEAQRIVQELRDVLVELQHEVMPSTPEQQEAYFQEQVAQGEKLATMGPDKYITSASHFYRAMIVYPMPDELMQIYTKVVPEPILRMITLLNEMRGASSSFGAQRVGTQQNSAQQQLFAALQEIDDAAADPAVPIAGAGVGSEAATGGAAGWEEVDVAAQA